MVNRAKLEAIISRGVTLSTLPGTRAGLAKVIANPESTFGEVGHSISADCVLVAHLMQKANAVKKTPPEPVLTITKALRVVGLRALSDLVQAQPVLTMLELSFPDGSTFPIEDLWKHSLATGIAARAIASQVGYPEPEECYIAGLLHDIGKIFLCQSFNDGFKKTVSEAVEESNTFYHCEVETGEASHAQVARLLAKSWELPSKFVDAIGLHHTPQLANENGKITAAVHVGDVLARSLGLGWGGDPYVPPIKSTILPLLGLQPVQVQEVMNRLEGEFARSSTLIS